MGQYSEMQIDLMTQVFDTMQQYEDGNKNALDAYLQLRHFKEQAQEICDAIKEWEYLNAEIIANEANDYPQGYNGYKVAMVGGRKTYDFSRINEIQEAKDRVKELEDKYKAILEAKLKGATHANVSDDGEELELPEINYGKGYLKASKL